MGVPVATRRRASAVEVALAVVPMVEALFVRPFDPGTGANGLFGIWLVRVPARLDHVRALFSSQEWGARPCHIRLTTAEERTWRLGAWFFDGSRACPGA